MEKQPEDEKPVLLPAGGQKFIVELVSQDGREKFLLDLSRARIDLRKLKFQNRARKVAILARLDLSGPPHRNPDGEEVPPPHLHLYCEGYGDKWAIPLPKEMFPDSESELSVLESFMRFCNIRDTAAVQLHLL